jgi:hypothetical protein
MIGLLPHPGEKVKARTGSPEPGEVVGPATDVPGSLAGWRVPVPGLDTGAAVVGDEPDLHGADTSSTD